MLALGSRHLVGAHSGCDALLVAVAVWLPHESHPFELLIAESQTLPVAFAWATWPHVPLTVTLVLAYNVLLHGINHHSCDVAEFSPTWVPWAFLTLSSIVDVALLAQ